MITRAAVIGGSVAGLLSARVLSEHVPRVVIVESGTLGHAPSLPAAGQARPPRFASSASQERRPGPTSSRSSAKVTIAFR